MYICKKEISLDTATGINVLNRTQRYTNTYTIHKLEGDMHL